MRGLAMLGKVRITKKIILARHGEVGYGSVLLGLAGRCWVR